MGAVVQDRLGNLKGFTPDFKGQSGSSRLGDERAWANGWNLGARFE
jgi:hypothetical protein